MELTNEQLMIRDMARDFAREKLLPGAAKRDETGEFPAEEVAEMGRLGLMGMLIPEEWGGAATGYVPFVLAVAEIAGGDAGCSTILSVQNSLVGTAILRFGTEEQKKKFLTPLATGEWIGAFALTEPQAGSDAAALKTTARKEGSDYILNGSKQFITSGKFGQLTLVFALTDKEKGKQGISAFLVPTDTPGYIVAGLEHKMGQRSSDTAQLVFEEMRVPEANRLGAEGEGYKIALANLEGGRIGIAAQSLGLAQAGYDAALAYAQERTSFGKPLIDHQAVGFRLADMATRLEAARHLVMEAARLRDLGQPCLKEACMAKLFASEAAEKILREAIQVFGGYGYVADFPVERFYRDARVCSIYEGTSDIQRLIITREIKKANA